MAWENTTNQTKKVVVHKDGTTQEYSYDANTTLGDAVTRTAQTARLNTVIVKCDGNEVQPDAGTRPLREFQTIEIFPKFAGAQ